MDTTDTAPLVCTQCWKLERLRVPLVQVGPSRWQHADVRRARGCGVFEYRNPPTQPKREELEATAA